METINIRDIRGADLRERARSGKPLAITNRGALIGIVVPVAAAWLEHLIDYNLSQVHQNINEAELAMDEGAPLATPDDVMGTAEPPRPPGTANRGAPGRPVPLAAVLVGGKVTQAPQSREIVRGLQGVLNPGRPAAGGEGEAAEPTVRTVRMGDLSARVIEQAGEAGQTLALTHDRELIGIVIPVTRGLVEFLIEQNMSRVLYNVGLAEKEIKTPGEAVLIGEALGQAAARDRQAEIRGSAGTPPPATG